jgi:hypothetical protein
MHKPAGGFVSFFDDGAGRRGKDTYAPGVPFMNIHERRRLDKIDG